MTFRKEEKKRPWHSIAFPGKGSLFLTQDCFSQGRFSWHKIAFHRVAFHGTESLFIGLLFLVQDCFLHDRFSWHRIAFHRVAFHGTGLLFTGLLFLAQDCFQQGRFSWHRIAFHRVACPGTGLLSTGSLFIAQDCFQQGRFSGHRVAFPECHPDQTIQQGGHHKVIDPLCPDLWLDHRSSEAVAIGNSDRLLLCGRLFTFLLTRLASHAVVVCCRSVNGLFGKCTRVWYFTVWKAGGGGGEKRK